MLPPSPTIKARGNSRPNFSLFMCHLSLCFSLKYSFFAFYILVFIDLILLCGDIEENPVSKTKPNDNLAVGHWNVNSIPYHNFQKIAVLKNFVKVHKFHIICISGTILNNICKHNYLNLNGYNMLRANHPSNAKS